MAKTLKTDVIKRSIIIDGHKTSISLENEFWTALHEIATRAQVSISALVADINKNRRTCNLSSAVRTFVFTQLSGVNQNGHVWKGARLRARAEECRTLADGLRDTRMIMLRIAADYERIADRMDEQETTPLTFVVNPDNTSSSVSRTVRGSGLSKTSVKATTSSDGVSSGSQPVQQKRTFTPPSEKTFLGGPLIEPK